MSRIFFFVLALSLWAMPHADAASAARTLEREVSFNIAPQALDSALLEFSKQADVQVMVAAKATGAQTTKGLSGKLSVNEALTSLLRGTGLKFTSDGNTVTIEPMRAAEGGKLQEGVRLAQGAAPQASTDQGQAGESKSQAQEGKEELTEIVVTAQKRIERIQDVPVPVSAVDAESLVNNNQLRLQDYYASVPALGMSINYNGAPTVSMRGLSTGNQTNPTVGIVVDDVPFGSSTALGGGFFAPDMDPSELTRIEVLRGPQGTLYGANSLGGLIKYVTVDPSTEGVSGRVQAGLNSVKNGDDVGYSVRGSVNVPLGETWAVRASGFTRQDPGYIDNVLTGQNGINRVDVDGGRLATLWKPSENVALRLSALFQDAKMHGAPDVDVQPGLGDLQQSTPRGTGEHETKIQSYRANITAKLGSVDLTAISGYSIGQNSGSTDLTAISFFTGLAESAYGVGGVSLIDDANRTDKFTQEIRLSAPIGEKLEWLLGGFYTHEGSHYAQSPTAINLLTGMPAGLLDYVDSHLTFREYAAFADLTVHFTDQFDVQFGGRESHNKQHYETVLTGPFTTDIVGFPSPVTPPTVDSDENSFTYLVTPRYRMSPDLMVYARLSSGFRLGGPNNNASPNILPPFKSDKTRNYEIGVKGDVAEHLLSFDASLYYINWRDIQIQSSDVSTGATIYVNGGRAKSQGVELSVQMRPIRGLSISAWGAWNDAALTENFPAGSIAVGFAGDSLPYSNRFSGNFSLEQSFPIANGMTGFIGGAVSYVGAREGIFANIFTPTPERQIFPSYAQTDLRAGVTYKSWTTNLSVNNAGDRRGVLTGGLDNINPAAFNYIQPRTIGLSLARTF